MFSLRVGVDNFSDDIALMLGEQRRPGKFWKICWKYISPLILLVMRIFDSFRRKEPWHICLCLSLFNLTVYNCLFVVILSRSNTWWLYISIMGTYTWMGRGNRLSWLAAIHLHRGNLPPWHMECTMRGEDKPLLIDSGWIISSSSSSPHLDYQTSTPTPQRMGSTPWRTSPIIDALWQ